MKDVIVSWMSSNISKTDFNSSCCYRKLFFSLRSGLEWTLRNGIWYFYPRFFPENGLVWGLLSGEFKDVSMGKFSNKTALGVAWSVFY